MMLTHTVHDFCLNVASFFDKHSYYYLIWLTDFKHLWLYRQSCTYNNYSHNMLISSSVYNYDTCIPLAKYVASLLCGQN